MTQNRKTCQKCGAPIMKVVVNDLRIVDFEIAGRCPECAAEDGMTAGEAMEGLTTAMQMAGELGYSTSDSNGVSELDQSYK